MSMIEQLEAMLARGQDNALLRFGLGNVFFKQKEWNKAVEHLGMAVHHDPGYSAAWKLLGRALAQAGRRAEAVEAFERGIRVAGDKGDVQAVREMKVFLKRLRKDPTA